MGLAFRIYALFRTIIDHLIDCLFGLYFNSRRKYLPKISDRIVSESASSLARKIRSKQLKSEDVVRAFVDRIKAVNDILNAVVDSRFEEALSEARALDARILRDEVSEEEFRAKPFLGVPFTTKETTACEGLSSSYGLTCRKGAKANFDATVIEAMKGSGAILLGVTNVPQLNLWPETYNPVYGVTNNPYDTTRNVGGSSGGEGSIVAAGGSPLGIGTDIAGSIRIPCFRCGIFGHKPTADIINTKGLTFRDGTEGPTMVVAGPMSRHAEDLLPALKLLVGKTDKLNLDTPVDVTKLNIFYATDVENFLASPISSEMKSVTRKCVAYFEESRRRTEELELEGFRAGFRLWSYVMAREKSNFASEIMDRNGEARWLPELARYALRKSDFNFYTILNLINKALPKPRPEWAEPKMSELKRELIAKLGTNGVLLFPSEAFPASYHFASTLRPYNIHLYALWSALKFPVTQVPLGINEKGLPVGIQVVGAPYQDHLTIAVACELEKAFGGHVPPVETVN